jgi:hypothetical protein
VSATFVAEIAESTHLKGLPHTFVYIVYFHNMRMEKYCEIVKIVTMPFSCKCCLKRPAEIGELGFHLKRLFDFDLLCSGRTFPLRKGSFLRTLCSESTFS